MAILKKMAAVLVPVVAISLWAGAANATQNCATHDDAVAALGKKYSEQIVSRGLNKDGSRMVEIFASKSGTWTLVVTDTSGVSCVVANGDAWHDVPAQPALVSKKDS